MLYCKNQILEKIDGRKLRALSGKAKIVQTKAILIFLEIILL